VSASLKIEKLRSDHSLDGFDYCREELNRFLARFALSSQQAGAAMTYLAVSGATIVGYYSLAVGEVACEEAPDRLKKGLARHPIPIMFIAVVIFQDFTYLRSRVRVPQPQHSVTDITVNS
jgi:hypothetical protein